VFLKRLNYRTVILAFIFDVCASALLANKADSLRAILATEKNDTTIINLHFKIAASIIESDSVTAEKEIAIANSLLQKQANQIFILKSYDKAGRIFYNNEQLVKSWNYWQLGLILAKRYQNNEWMARLYIRLAEQLHFNDLSKQAIVFYDSAAMFSSSLNDVVKASFFKNRGRAFYDVGDYKQAMNYYILSQKTFEKNKWITRDYGHLLHFIGSVFKRQKEYQKALDYYLKELELAKKINDISLEAEALYLCAAMYGEQGDIKKDMEYQMKALEIYKSMNNQKSIALMLGNISSNYAQLKDYKKAIEYCNQALEIYKQEGEEEKEGWIYRALGEYHSQLGLHKQAMEYFNKAIEHTMKSETKQLLNLSEIKNDMAFAYYRMGNYRDAFDNYLDFQNLKDSLSNTENREYLQSLEAQYGNEKKEKEITLLNKDKQMHLVEISKKETQRNALLTVIVLVLIIAGLSVFAFVGKQKTAKLLARQVEEINHKNLEIQEKNKDITDSIQYAKRLQDAVFPDPKELSVFFAESFVLFRPKDIVSGDFYWFEHYGNEAILVVGDCTGHGVPGAFMSIMGHNLLNQIVLEEEIHEPSKILTELDKRVTATLNKKTSKQEHHDGMDIAICLIRKAQKKLIYAGANRPLIINRSKSIIEIKPDKFAIGGAFNTGKKTFTDKEVKLDDNDVLFLFSDGYQDQFGGPKGKKLKYKNLQELFLNTAGGLKEQAEVLDKRFEEWKGALEQIDDVTVIGIKVG
jgi:serine phosphatase RsbU (regulator of sigma subunit)